MKAISSLFSYVKELPLAIAHGNRNGAVVSHGNERQSPQNRGDGHDVDDRLWFRLTQLLRPALASLPPPRGVFLSQCAKRFTNSLVSIEQLKQRLVLVGTSCSHFVYTELLEGCTFKLVPFWSIVIKTIGGQDCSNLHDWFAMACLVWIWRTNCEPNQPE